MSQVIRGGKKYSFIPTLRLQHSFSSSRGGKDLPDRGRSESCRLQVRTGHRTPHKLTRWHTLGFPWAREKTEMVQRRVKKDGWWFYPNGVLGKWLTWLLRVAMSTLSQNIAFRWSKIVTFTKKTNAKGQVQLQFVDDMLIRHKGKQIWVINLVNSNQKSWFDWQHRRLLSSYFFTFYHGGT